jgi:uncharacterized glyoxalase superfamily protein PhnB
VTLPRNEPLVKVAPEFYVRDLAASLSFYEALGFAHLRVERDFAVVALGEAQVMLATGREAPSAEPRLEVNVRIVVDDVDVLYGRALAGGGRIAVPIANRDYGLRDFIVADPDGFCLRFAQPI